MISQIALSEFKELYLKVYDIQLTDQQTVEYGTRLVQLIRTIYGSNLPKPKSIDNWANRDNSGRVPNEPIAFFDGRLGQSEQLGWVQPGRPFK